MSSIMEKLPLPDFATADAMKRQAENKRREGLVRRLSEFLSREAEGEAEHPAAIAEKALARGNTDPAIDYLSGEIDKATEKQDETRRGELMRWKVSLTQR